MLFLVIFIPFLLLASADVVTNILSKVGVHIWVWDAY